MGFAITKQPSRLCEHSSEQIRTTKLFNAGRRLALHTQFCEALVGGTSSYGEDHSQEYAGKRRGDPLHPRHFGKDRSGGAANPQAPSTLHGFANIPQKERVSHTRSALLFTFSFVKRGVVEAKRCLASPPQPGEPSRQVSRRRQRTYDARSRAVSLNGSTSADQSGCRESQDLSGKES